MLRASLVLLSLTATLFTATSASAQYVPAPVPGAGYYRPVPYGPMQTPSYGYSGFGYSVPGYVPRGNYVPAPGFGYTPYAPPAYAPTMGPGYAPRWTPGYGPSPSLYGGYYGQRAYAGYRGY